MRPESKHLETLAIHSGSAPDVGTGAVTQPLHLSTTFERDPDGGFTKGFSYTRHGNPNRAALEKALAAIEGGGTAVAFSSGSAAASTAFRSILRPGEHALIPDDMYHGIRKLLLHVLEPWGIRVTAVDMTDLGRVENSLTPLTRLVWLETPSNPLLKISDVAAIAELAHSAKALVVSDSTWSPARTLPALDLGADVVLHSTTKYLSGHSDVLGGALILREEDGLYERIRTLQQSEGAVPSPFDCWLTLRGMKTLPYRMRAHVENAGKVAEFLNEHPRVDEVFYPGLEEHPGHDVAKRQMSSFGGMLSFRVAGGEQGARNTAARVRLITRATSLGGVESLIEHRASVEGPDSLTPVDLLRMSVGLEHSDDLIADLEQALV